MCGLVGIMGAINSKEDKIFQEMLVVDSLRGPHSTGAAFIKANGAGRVVKNVGNPWDLFDTGGFKEGIKQFNKVLLGHNRWATIGGVTRTNAHPFNFSNLIGMHNGTLKGKSLDYLEDSDSFGTDSEALFNSLDKYDLKETIGNITGAWALVWVDKEFGTLNFLRNNERTLHYCMSKDKKALYFASEARLLKFVLAGESIDHTDIRLIAEDTHYSFKIPGPGEEISEPSREEVKGQPCLPLSYNTNRTTQLTVIGGSYGPAVSGQVLINNKVKSETTGEFFTYFDTNKKTNKWRVGKKTTGALPKELKKNFNTRDDATKAISGFLFEDSVSDLIEPECGDRWVTKNHSLEVIDEATGEPIPEKIYEDLCKDGCSTCGEVGMYGFDSVTWLNDHLWMCEQCYEDAKEMNGGEFNPVAIAGMLC